MTVTEAEGGKQTVMEEGEIKIIISHGGQFGIPATLKAAETIKLIAEAMRRAAMEAETMLYGGGRNA